MAVYRKRRSPADFLLFSSFAIFCAGAIMVFYFMTKAAPPRMRKTMNFDDCRQATDVYAVGSCEKFMTHMHNCNHGFDDEWYSDMIKAINNEAESLERNKLRELKLENGQTLTADSNLPIPNKVYALFDRELFVLPTCRVGAQYSVDVKSFAKQFNITVVSVSPRVLVAENVVTAEEAADIIRTAESKMEPSTVSGEGSVAKSLTMESRTSSTAWLNPSHYAVGAALRQRISELIGIDFDDPATPHIVVEELQVLRYEKSQHYHTHHDYFDPVQHTGFLGKDGRNRFVTVLFYLSDVEEGGETCFPASGDARLVTDYADCTRGIRVAPRLGRVAIFYSLHPQHQQLSHASALVAGQGGEMGTEALDVASWHGACDVVRGTKWAANYWITLKGVHLPI